jgi:hypothetical protein
MHFAQVLDNKVVNVIVAEQDVIDSGIFGEGWIQTSYNTNGGVHPNDTPLRKNFAGIGHTYDSVRDAFIEDQPYLSWTLNEESCKWVPPMPMPLDGNMYFWDEESTQWVVRA